MASCINSFYYQNQLVIRTKEYRIREGKDKKNVSESCPMPLSAHPRVYLFLLCKCTSYINMLVLPKHL